jgi:hypothetical protein
MKFVDNTVALDLVITLIRNEERFQKRVVDKRR